MEQMLRVHRVKFAGPGFSSMSPERRKKARRSGLYTETECALASKEQKDCGLDRNAVGVLSTSGEVQVRMDLARR